MCDGTRFSVCSFGAAAILPQLLLPAACSSGDFVVVREGNDASSGSSSGSSSSGSSAADDAGIPPGIPGAGGSCNPVPMITGTLVTQLLATASKANCTDIVPDSTLNGGMGHIDNGSGAMVNICQLKGAIYWQSGMDVDCDGLADTCTNGISLGSSSATQHCPSDDPTYFDETSFTNAKGQFLSAGLIPYVVISQDITNVTGLNNTDTGGNVVAVIYNNELIFAVFGDQGPVGYVGESSYMTAASLGINPDPNTGGTNGPVTFIVFTSAGAVPQDLGDPLEAWQIGLPLAEQFIADNP
jgi:hypothetical protein